MPHTQSHMTLIAALATMLKPVIRLMLKGGIGYAEFSNVAKSVFVEIATQEYGLRGRPTNASRVSAITGISRKQVGQLRRQGLLVKWTPSMETTPLNAILHFWHHDPEFSEAPGRPRALPPEGSASFATLVARYGGDIPVGAIRASLIRAGSASEDDRGWLAARAAYYFPTKYSDDFIRGIAFSFGSLGSTLVHNATLRQQANSTREEQIRKSRIERTVWSDHLTEEDIAKFKAWARERGEVFAKEANQWVGEHELPQEEWKGDDRTIGVGIYYFEEDRPGLDEPR
jgi:hypothetical protein